MNTTLLDEQLLEINRKLDVLTEHAQRAARREQEKAELKADLSRIGVDIFQTLVHELDEVSHHFELDDALTLIKKLLRNTREISQLIDQMKSLHDLATDAMPMGRQAFLELIETLNELERKGYFEFIHELFRVAAKIMNTFTVEDVRALGENIATILMTVKNLTQPEILHTVNNAVSVYKNLDIEIDDKVSYWDLIKLAKSPEMKRGLAFGIQFLHNIADAPRPSNHQHPAKSNA